LKNGQSHGDILEDNEFIPYNRPSVDEEDIAEVVKTLRSGWLTQGPKTIEFEEQIAAYCDAKYAVAVNSCTAALHLSLLAFGIGPGDEVITTPYTFASTGNVIVHSGARPVFADIQSDTCNISPDAINEVITKKTKAIIPVHYAGQACDMDEILAIARDHNLRVIVDAAHAIGSDYRGRKTGCDGDATCFSFYATKNLTTGEGGAVTTNNDEIRQKIQLLRLHGISRDAWKRYTREGSWYYEIEECGWKYNLTDINAALGCSQIAKLDRFNKRRREIAARYTSVFGKRDDLIVPAERPDRNHVFHVYSLLLRKHDRGDFINEMTKRGVGCSVHFIPLHLHPFYMKTYGHKRGDYPIAEWIYDREVSLPLYPSMSNMEVEQVINITLDVLDGNPPR
jgi:dTDP-4-amino-4,6-dideoxygalactose transaminase